MGGPLALCFLWVGPAWGRETEGTWSQHQGTHWLRSWTGKPGGHISENKFQTFYLSKAYFKVIWSLATLSLMVFLASLMDIGNLGPSSVFSANSKNTSPFQKVLSWAMRRNLVDILAMTFIKKPWLNSSRCFWLLHLWHDGIKNHYLKLIISPSKTVPC